MDMIVIAALFLIAAIGGALTGWSMWLEHRRQRRMLDIVAAAIDAGREPPPELLAGLVASAAPVQAGRPERALWRGAMFFLVVSVACFLASWAVDEAMHERSLLMVAGISAATGIGLLIVQYVGRRFGL